MIYVECPRDAWQGLEHIIPTELKQQHLKALLAAGFQHLDLGSFVSPKAVPQMADTEDVLAGLERPEGVDFLCIIANARGLERAIAAPNVTSVGYPLSVNDTFQRRNTNRSLEDSWPLVKALAEDAHAAGLELVVYVSMGFGNPYNEPWQAADTASAVMRLRDSGVSRIALADTVGSATPERLGDVLAVIPEAHRLGLHLHARPGAWQGQLERALEYGISWFEGALSGIGGCPFAGDALVGNLPTEAVLPWLKTQGRTSPVKDEALEWLAAEASRLATGSQ